MAESPSSRVLPYERVRSYLLEAEPRDVYHALPKHLADALDVPHRSALEALVGLMFDGDAKMHWELECPFCKAFAEVGDVFQTAITDTTCGACGADFTVHVDHEAQVTFSPHSNLRALDEAADDRDYRAQVRQQYGPTTVHELMTIQRFRDWAQNEPLAPDEHLEVSQMTIWFSDLTGSTALYARNGDPFAYQLVREHFGLVGEAVQGAEGAIVKTMGDGVMGVFSRTVDAIDASLRVNRMLREFNEEKGLEADRRLRLKIGIHTGPSIVVTLNHRLDYFGTTVNTASRVSNLARGEEIVLTKASYAQPEVPARLTGYRIREFASQVRGLDDPITAYRVELYPREAQPRPGLLGFLDRLGRSK